MNISGEFDLSGFKSTFFIEFGQTFLHDIYNDDNNNSNNNNEDKNTNTHTYIYIYIYRGMATSPPTKNFWIRP